MTGNGFKRLGDTLRYLQAIEKRLEKLAIIHIATVHRC